MLKNGLHARPAAQLINELNAFQSDVKFQIGAKKINAKSILQLMGVSIAEGEKIKVIVCGADAGEAMACIETFLQADGGEGNS